MHDVTLHCAHCRGSWKKRASRTVACHHMPLPAVSFCAFSRPDRWTAAHLFTRNTTCLAYMLLNTAYCPYCQSIATTRTANLSLACYNVCCFGLAMMSTSTRSRIPLLHAVCMMDTTSHVHLVRWNHARTVKCVALTKLSTLVLASITTAHSTTSLLSQLPSGPAPGVDTQHSKRRGIKARERHRVKP